MKWLNFFSNVSSKSFSKTNLNFSEHLNWADTKKGSIGAHFILVSLYIFCKANKKVDVEIQQVYNKEIYFSSHFFHRIKFHSFTARQIFITH